jgi:hypothetical protein
MLMAGFNLLAACFPASTDAPDYAWPGMTWDHTLNDYCHTAGRVYFPLTRFAASTETPD